MRRIAFCFLLTGISGCAVTTIEQVTYISDSAANINIPIDNKIVVLADDSESERYVLKTIAVLNEQGYKYVYTEQGTLVTKIEPDMSVILSLTKNGSRTGSVMRTRSNGSSGGASKSGYVSGVTSGGNRGSSSLGPSGPSVARNISRFSAQWYDIKNDKVVMQNTVTAATPLPCNDQKVNAFLAEQFL